MERVSWTLLRSALCNGHFSSVICIFILWHDYFASSVFVFFWKLFPQKTLVVNVQRCVHVSPFLQWLLMMEFFLMALSVVCGRRHQHYPSAETERINVLDGAYPFDRTGYMHECMQGGGARGTIEAKEIVFIQVESRYW